MSYVVLAYSYISFAAPCGKLCFVYLLGYIVGICRTFRTASQVFFYLCFGFCQFGAETFVLLFQQSDALIVLCQFCAVLLQLCHPDRYFKCCFFIVQHLELLSLFALLFKRSDTRFKFGYDIVKAGYIVLRIDKLALSLLLFIAEFRNARSFLEDFSPVTALAVYDIRDTSLTDYGIAVLS